MSVTRVTSKVNSNHLYSISVITSSGKVVVLNLAGMFDAKATFEGVYFSSFSLKVEPRLTCICSWAVTARAKSEIATTPTRHDQDVDDNDAIRPNSKKQVRFKKREAQSMTVVGEGKDKSQTRKKKKDV